MENLLGSYEFWFGAVLLTAFQIGKFGEINQHDDDLKDRSAVVPNLRASDFLGQTPYLGTLVLFLAVTLGGYLLLCLASPSLIKGWLQVVGGTTDTAAMDKVTQASSYPLWIAAGFMGLAHQAIPGFKNLANLQRDVFHDLVGIPRDVIDTSAAFSTQILAQSAEREAMARRLGELCSDRWRVGIEPIADTRFFRNELERLKLDADDDLREALGASPRELRTWLRQVVYIACIATVRKSGGRGLAELARQLGVRLPMVPGSLRDLLGPLLGSAVTLVVLLFLVPMADTLVQGLLGRIWFWPTGDDAIGYCSAYLIAQVVPVVIAAAILASSPLRRADTPNPGPGVLLIENAGTYVAIVVVVFLYSGAQTLWDYGSSTPEKLHDALRFFGGWTAYLLLQSLISLAVCVAIQWRSAQGLGPHAGRRLLDGLLVVAVALVVSAFYAFARLKYQFHQPQEIDFLLLVVILNGVAAAIAFVFCQSVWRRRAARRTATAATLTGTTPATALAPATTARLESELAMANPR